MEQKNILVSREEYENMKETIEILQDKELVKELVEASNRVASGKYLTEEEFFKN